MKGEANPKPPSAGERPMLRKYALALLGCAGLALAPLAASAADEVKVGMLRLPTALFIGIDQGFFAA